MSHHSFSQNLFDSPGSICCQPRVEKLELFVAFPLTCQEWKFEGSLFVPVCPGCAPEAQWCRGGYDAQTPYYQLVVKVPSNAKGVVTTQVEWFQKPVVDGLLHVFSSCTFMSVKCDEIVMYRFIEGSLEVKLRTIWTNEKQRWEEKKKEDQKGESFRRKKIQAREKVGKSQNTMFFQ